MKFYGIKTLKNGKYNDTYKDSKIWLIWEIISTAFMIASVIVTCNLSKTCTQAIVWIFSIMLLYCVISFVVMTYLSACVSYIGPLED